ncbi:MAG: peptidase M14 [Gammaproteobacteria bacterium]|nr:MAG: peptidase M14 [Gammaproteobacteria bacterium]RTZ59974.1 MAG: peptidase M14 [Gammaproteobacteria bacterium]
MLNILEQIPAGFLDARAGDLQDLLGGPTLIHLAGEREQPLFVSVLLHGNETTGLLTVQRLLKRYLSGLPRSLSIFIGNTAAAVRNMRRLDGQPDYNRIWKGNGAPEYAMAQKVLDEMRRRKVFIAVDIHNNTGLNPHYSVVTCLQNPHLQLAAMFSRIALEVVRPDTTSTNAFSGLCPAVTLESGLPGKEHGTDHVLDFVDGCLHMSHVPDTPVHAHDLELYHAVAVVKVSRDCSIGFDDYSADISFPSDLDRLNFRELDRDVCIARIHPQSQACLTVTDEQGKDVSNDWFQKRDDHVCTVGPIMPAMLTRNVKIIHQDCLCYLMSRKLLPQQLPKKAMS